MEVHKQH